MVSRQLNWTTHWSWFHNGVGTIFCQKDQYPTTPPSDVGFKKQKDILFKRINRFLTGITTWKKRRGMVGIRQTKRCRRTNEASKPFLFADPLQWSVSSYCVMFLITFSSVCFLFSFSKRNYRPPNSAEEKKKGTNLNAVIWNAAIGTVNL